MCFQIQTCTAATAGAGETAKISVRNARKKGMDLIKKAKLPEVGLYAQVESSRPIA
jgi:hypothetical protein